METLKKHLEIYKINRQIRHLRNEANSEVVGPFHYIGNVPYRQTDAFARPSEKNEIIRQSINDLIEQKDALRNS